MTNKIRLISQALVEIVWRAKLYHTVPAEHDSKSIMFDDMGKVVFAMSEVPGENQCGSTELGGATSPVLYRQNPVPSVRLCNELVISFGNPAAL